MEEEIRAFAEEAKSLTEPGDLENVDSVLQVSVSANYKLYEVKYNKPSPSVFCKKKRFACLTIL